ncbi:MAG: helix-turn-helix domain-containing protein [Pseudomonadota bacterium]
MSHVATTWAIQQRGLKPATKLVLWHLADCHNRHTGRCDPSQSRLAEECEMSRSSLNVHLDLLEERGFISRIRRRDSNSNRKKRTQYRLAFSERETGAESDGETAENPCPETGHGAANSMSGKAQKPCPENGDFHVQNPDRNLGIEPGIEPGTEREGARERADDQSDLKKSGSHVEQSEARDPDHEKPEPHPLTDPKKSEGAFYRAFKAYPRFDVAPKGPMLAAWAKRPTDERAMITAERVAAYVALCRTEKVNHPPAISTVLDERLLFTDAVEARIAGEKAPAETVVLKPFGSGWMAHRLALLARGPTGTWRPTRLQQLLIADGKGHAVTGDRARAEHPAVARLDEFAGEGKGVPVPRAAVPDVEGRFTPHGPGSDHFEAWHAHHVAKGWPWPHLPAGVAVMWLPKDLPNE